MSVVFFILTVLVAPFLPAGATIPRWAFLSLSCAVLMFRTEFTLTAWLIAGYVAVMAYVAPVGYDAAFLYWHFLLYLIVFLCAYRMDLRKIAIAVALGMTVNSAVEVAQYFGWHIMPTTAQPESGLFYNGNIASETAAMALVLVVGYRLWWLVPGLLPTLYLGSRAPVLALGVAGLIAMWKWESKFPALICAIGAVVVALAIHTPGFDTLMQRVGVWQDMLPHFSPLGHGLGSFIVDYPAFQHHSNPLMLRWENAHNDILQVVYELGIGGALLVGALIFRMATGERGPAFYALLVFLVEGCFGFPLYEPATGALAMVCAGRLFVGSPALFELVDSVRLRIRHRLARRQYSALPGGFEIVSFDADKTIGRGL